VKKNFTQQSSGISSSYISRLAQHSKIINKLKRKKKNHKIIPTDAAKALHKMLQIFLTQIKLSAN